MTVAKPTAGERIVVLVKTLVLVRHGKAPKATPEQRDEVRALNELGIAQARKLGAKIADLTFDTVVSSPLKRACETVKIATDDRYTVEVIPELTCPTDGVHPIDRMFNELGYKPLSAYFAHKLGFHLGVWGQTALEKVLDALDDTPNQTVLVGGHAVLQNALGWAFCAAIVQSGATIAPKSKELLLTTVLGEGEAFMLCPAIGLQDEVACEHIKLD